MFQLHGQEGPIGDRFNNLDDIVRPMLTESISMMLILNSDGNYDGNYDGLLNRTDQLNLVFRIIKY